MFLNDFKWYRRLRGGTWYRNFYSHVERVEARWTKKHLPLSPADSYTIAIEHWYKSNGKKVYVRYYVITRKFEGSSEGVDILTKILKL